MQNFGFIIPIYMHGKTLDKLLQGIENFPFAKILVDDGNPSDIKQKIFEVAKKHKNTYIVTIHKNSGKGAAVTAGMQKAKDLKLSHVLQIDADLQHDLSSVQHFFDLSRQNPTAIICGYPEYDKSVPLARKNCRKLANFWVHINSLCKDAKDTMCGFRVYLVDSYLSIDKKYHLAKRMCVDCQVLIFSSWQNIPIVNASVRVTYPKDGISNYKAFGDTVFLIFMFFSTFFRMLFHLPAILSKRYSKKTLSQKQK